MNDLERRVRERTEVFQAEITERKRAEEARNRQVAFENIVSKILARFASCTAAEVDDEITAGLKEIGLFLGMDDGFRHPVLEGITHMGYSLRLDRTGVPFHRTKISECARWDQSLERESLTWDGSHSAQLPGRPSSGGRIRETRIGKPRCKIAASGPTARPGRTCNRLCRISFLFA